MHPMGRRKENQGRKDRLLFETLNPKTPKPWILAQGSLNMAKSEGACGSWLGFRV